MQRDPIENSKEVCVNLRKVTIADSAMVFEWRNLPEIVALSKTRRVVEWEEHLGWFEGIIRRDGDLFLLVLLGEIPVGTVRFEQVSENSTEISIYIISTYTGKGYGVQALKKACVQAFASLKIDEIIAVIRTDNAYSLSAFRKAGFNLREEKIVTQDNFVMLTNKRRPLN